MRIPRMCVFSFMALFMCGANAEAQDMIEGAISAAAGASTVFGTNVPPVSSTASMIDKLQRDGYSNITGPEAGYSSNGLILFSANAPGGMPVDVTVDPITNRVISAIPKP